MAKKKTIDLRSNAEVPAGDVNITYNNVRIAGFSEDTDATLKTGGTRVEHDIELTYTKPESLTYIPLTVTDTAEAIHGVIQIPISGAYTCSEFIYQNIDGQIYAQNYSEAGTDHIVGILPVYYSLSTPEKYKVAISIASREDNLTVVFNGTPITYDDREEAYLCQAETTVYPETGYTLSISDKEGK